MMIYYEFTKYNQNIAHDTIVIRHNITTLIPNSQCFPIRILTMKQISIFYMYI